MLRSVTASAWGAVPASNQHLSARSISWTDRGSFQLPPPEPSASKGRHTLGTLAMGHEFDAGRHGEQGER